MNQPTGYIIHARPHNDRTQFLVVFTKQQGVQSIAVSAKTRFNYFCEYPLYASKNKLKLLNTTTTPPPLSGKSLYCALYLNELLYKFCKQGDENSTLYEDYALCLQQLAQPQNTETTLRYFELRLLKTSGYEIDIQHISEPYVIFCKHLGFIGSQTPGEQGIAYQELKKMIDHLQPSFAIKSFLRHVIKSLLSTKIESGLFYETL